MNNDPSSGQAPDATPATKYKVTQATPEERGLRWTATGTVVVLLGVLIGSLAALVCYAVEPTWLPSPFEQVLIGAIAGTSGSSFRALWSACERIAKGWELRDGTKLPKEEPRDKF